MTIAGRLTQFVSALASLSLATSIFAQVEQPLPPAPEVLTTTWFYWVLPLFATIIALTIGLNMHGQRVRATIETWPKPIHPSVSSVSDLSSPRPSRSGSSPQFLPGSPSRLEPVTNGFFIEPWP